MRQASPIALALLAAALLAGCGAAPGATLATATTPAAAPAAPVATVTNTSTPSINVTSAKAEHEPGVTVIATRDIPDAELKADAQADGYTLSDYSVPSVVGYVRHSDGPGYLLEASVNELGVKAPTKYFLYCTDLATYNYLADHVNQRLTIKGVFSADHVVAVSYAGTALDLSFLLNWWTKGKITGQVISTVGIPLVNATVKARSSEGYVYLGSSDNSGNFKLPNLEAGSYQITFSKNNTSVSSMVTVGSHKATELQGVLPSL